MKKNKADKVKEIHTSSICQGKDGRYSTKVGSGRNNRRTIKAKSEEELFEKLYNYYFCSDKSKEKTFTELFDLFYTYYKDNNKLRKKTLDDYKFDFNRFFKNDSLSDLTLSEITTKKLSMFLDRAHQILSKEDVQRGKDCIEKHRHDSIRTIIRHVYHYSNTYMGTEYTCPIDALNYSDWRYYKTSDLEHDWYCAEDRIKLSTLFSRMESPTLEECCAAFVLETSARNSEARAIRFEDFHFNNENNYVRICGMAEAGHRDERIKADSWAGKRNCPMTENLVKIFKIAKELSWSDTYLFVRDPKKVIESEILITSQGLQRGLMSLCKKANVDYLPPHQVRFSDATLMAMQGRNSASIQGRLGHTTPGMAEKYIRKVEQSTIFSGPELYPHEPTEE